MERWQDPLHIFKTYLSFKTISHEGPQGAYQACVDYLYDFCKHLDLHPQIHEWVAHKPVLIATWQGTEP